jgi:hypothetical protein
MATRGTTGDGRAFLGAESLRLAASTTFITFAAVSVSTGVSTAVSPGLEVISTTDWWPRDHPPVSDSNKAASDVVQTCGKQTSVSDALRYLHTPSIAFQTPGAAPPLNTQPPQPELSLACAVHPFKAGDRDRSVAELLNPSITATRCLTLRWSCLIKLLRYFEDRSSPWG